MNHALFGPYQAVLWRLGLSRAPKINTRLSNTNTRHHLSGFRLSHTYRPCASPTVMRHVAHGSRLGLDATTSTHTTPHHRPTSLQPRGPPRAVKSSPSHVLMGPRSRVAATTTRTESMAGERGAHAPCCCCRRRHPRTQSGRWVYRDVSRETYTITCPAACSGGCM